MPSTRSLGNDPIASTGRADLCLDAEGRTFELGDRTKCVVASPIAPATTPPAYVVLTRSDDTTGWHELRHARQHRLRCEQECGRHLPTVACQPHNLYHPTYPRQANDCTACHDVAKLDTIPDQSKAVATTIDAGKIDSGSGGSAVWKNQLDDTLQGASAAHARAATHGPTPRVMRTRMAGRRRPSRTASDDP